MPLEPFLFERGFDLHATFPLPFQKSLKGLVIGLLTMLGTKGVSSSLKIWERVCYAPAPASCPAQRRAAFSPGSSSCTNTPHRQVRKEGKAFLRDAATRAKH